MNDFVVKFEEGRKEDKFLLGGKGANLAEMTKIGLPVPPGFTITTKACKEYYEKGRKISEAMEEEILDHLRYLEQQTRKSFGKGPNPLLVSVRSGAAISMPGMMDTVLNLGLNHETVKDLARKTDNPRFAYDSFRRFIQMYADVVLGLGKRPFDELLEEVKEKEGVDQDYELSAQGLQDLIAAYEAHVLKETKKPFPQEPKDQLMKAVEAVFSSWNNNRAKIYRKSQGISDDLGTAVNIQAMVFGNMGDKCGTGVAFTRNPATGEEGVFGEFLMNAQGEDVVAGIRTPLPIAEMKKVAPQAYEEFLSVCELLENHYRDMQDIEFTIEEEKLYLLQTRTGKRTAKAAVKVAVDLVKEEKISKEEALMRIDPVQIDQLLHPTFSEQALQEAKKITSGLPASPGAASGKIYFYPEDVVAAKERGEEAILVRQETSPEDIEGMIAAQGILTSRGGMTSHAAVVARGMGKCCVAGVSTLTVQEQRGIMRYQDKEYHEGDWISLDGSSGNIYEGKLDKTNALKEENFDLLMTWADELRSLGVRTNADTPRDAKIALDFGAEGIGLCRTEHMFFDEERIHHVRAMILSKDQKDQASALDYLLSYQKEDFKDLFMVMKDKPITIRLLDPPLHEFLPHESKEIEKLARDLGVGEEVIKSRIEGLKEFNPMLGHRGVRLGITHPEIYVMQIRAIFMGVAEAYESLKTYPKVEIMIPLVGFLKEFTAMKALLLDMAKELKESLGIEDFSYHIGTMIEVPRATLIADELARECDFFSFGTNDLTQMTLGFSRDDAGKFIMAYENQGIFEKDPFQEIDAQGVGQLVKLAVKKGREEKKTLKIGVCGEQGGDPASIDFFYKTGLDYVSCSPYRVPIARLAAAQSKIKNT